MKRAAAMVLLAMMMGLGLSLLVALLAAAWSNIDHWPEETPVDATRSHLPAYLRGVWSDPVRVTTNRAAAWGVSQTTITCEDDRIIMRSAFGWPARCMHYDMFSVNRPGAAAANMASIREASDRAGLSNGRPFPAWAPVDRASWMGPRRLMPLSPRWAGLAANTLIYGAALLLLVWVPRAIRRGRRRSRGLCERCAYPVGPSGGCSECGAILPAASHGRPAA